MYKGEQEGCERWGFIINERRPLVVVVDVNFHLVVINAVTCTVLSKINAIEVEEIENPKKIKEQKAFFCFLRGVEGDCHVLFKFETHLRWRH